MSRSKQADKSNNAWFNNIEFAIFIFFISLFNGAPTWAIQTLKKPEADNPNAGFGSFQNKI
jgi:hypothetical protein